MATQEMGFIGEIRASANEDPTFNYNLITPDFSRTPKRPNVPFRESRNYPTCTVVYNQRRIYISTINNPLTLFASAVAEYDDFSLSDHVDAAFELTLDSRSFDPINYAVSSQFGLVLFSERNVWFVVSREGGGIAADNVFIKSEINSGAKKDLPPLNILNNLLFVSNLDNTPRVLVPVNTTPNQFSTQDLALYSQHFFGVHKTFIEDVTLASTFDPRHRSGAEIISWTYAGRPGRVLWAVRADGLLLNCTYSPEHEISAWSKHATKGRFRAVQSVYERNQDSVYMVVERGGHSFIECLSKRDASQLEDSVPVDAAVRTENLEPSEPTVLRIYDVVDGEALGEDSDERFALSNIGNNYTGLAITIPDTNSAVTFSTALVGGGIFIRTRGGVYRVLVRRNSRTLQVEAISEVDEGDPEYFVHNTSVRQPIYQWEIVDRNSVSNAFHLQNQQVYSIEGNVLVKGDGPGDDGEFSTGNGDARGLTVGLPFTSRVTTLPFIAAEGIIEDKPKRMFGVSLRCIDSSSMQAGVADDLYPVIHDDDGDEKTEFSSGVFPVEVGGEWELDDILSIESNLPFNILGIVINYDTGDEERSRSGLRGRINSTI